MNTTVFRSGGTITNPPPGSVVLPSLGLSPIARYPASSLRGNVGDVVQTMSDVVAGRDMHALRGVCKIDVFQGRRCLNLSSQAGDNALRSASFPMGRARTVALCGYFDEAPTGGSVQVARTRQITDTSGDAALAITTSAGAAIYAGGSQYPSRAMGAGWFRLIGVFDETAGAVAANSQITRGPLTWAAADYPACAWLAFTQQAVGMRIVDFAIFNVAATDEQILAIDNGLKAWVPA
ncbi:TPA: hypothetical protein ACKPX2_000586 [Stenotrophomonas maltophilia]|uniref:hypothetical protein n=1 Tax=Stenotrophomonas maltophilia TaxID=40324 RepID=UPI0013D9557D|nr:hypothetical protein [Stenotrophomonas maltophilia]MBH1660130.1 hypothetical protein [Stenotrophomonas maltophilia]MBH1732783.1 hypothetical protein [Stenotrophomonas maltophilia]HEL3245926.1 hypothetical protein [Stenotrophomonas maltophilia]